MWFQITNSQRMALCDILLDRTRNIKALQRFVDVTAGDGDKEVVTTPAQLLALLMQSGDDHLCGPCQHDLHDQCEESCGICHKACTCDHGRTDGVDTVIEDEEEEQVLADGVEREDEDDEDDDEDEDEEVDPDAPDAPEVEDTPVPPEDTLRCHGDDLPAGP